MTLNTYYLVNRACVPVSMQASAYPELPRLEQDPICRRGPEVNNVIVGMERSWLSVHLRSRVACEEPRVRRSYRWRQCGVKILRCVVRDPRLVLEDRVGSSAPSTVRCREVSDPASSRFLRKNCFFRMEAGMSSQAGMTMV